jgi:hypothetical protein
MEDKDIRNLAAKYKAASSKKKAFVRDKILEDGTLSRVKGGSAAACTPGSVSTEAVVDEGCS